MLKLAKPDERYIFLKENLAIFRETADGVIQGIEEAAVDGNARRLNHEAHQLKGMSLSMGAKKLALLSEQLEEKGFDGSTRVDPHTIDFLKGVLTASCKELDALLNTAL